jgi:hypothetical protein
MVQPGNWRKPKLMEKTEVEFVKTNLIQKN